MAEEWVSRRYCALFQLEAKSDIRRVAAAAPGLVGLVKQWSNEECEQLCRSNDGQLFGFLFRSKKPTAMMRSEFASSPFSQGSDSFIVFEIGEGFAGSGFSRAWTWLQHH